MQEEAPQRLVCTATPWERRPAPGLVITLTDIYHLKDGNRLDGCIQLERWLPQATDINHFSLRIFAFITLDREHLTTFVINGGKRK